MSVARWALLVSVVALGCGESEVDTTAVDTPHDVFDFANYAYEPEPLRAGDLDVDLAKLARRFNPAQVFTDPTLISTPVDYLLVEGSAAGGGVGLTSAPIKARQATTFELDLAAWKRVEGVDLLRDDWTKLPATDDTGRELAYWIDAPGDNTGKAADRETWTAEYVRRTQGAKYRPTQYARFFWLRKQQGLLAIQYWFYYPWRKFVDSREGVWEHVNVALDRKTGDFRIAFVQFTSRDHEEGFATGVRLADRDASVRGAHPIVFVGGEACADKWCGTTSGECFEAPGKYERSDGSTEIVAGGAVRPGRAIHANDFDVIVLPLDDEPVPPKLSWHRINFLAGQPEVRANSYEVLAANMARAQLRPGGGHPSFDRGIEKKARLKVIESATFEFPRDWQRIETASDR